MPVFSRETGDYRATRQLKNYILYFSPTGRTQLAAEGLTQAWDSERLWVDMGAQDLNPENIEFEDECTCILACPCFDGRIPEFYADKVRTLDGEGVRAVLLVTYGSIGFGDSLMELRDLAQDAGFYVHAAVTAPVQHALCEEIAHGRPTTKDLSELGMFGQLVRDYPDLCDTTLIVPGDRDYEEREQGMRFAPRADRNCNLCGECVAACPVEAIPENHPDRTDEHACISCMQCAAVCPTHARHLGEVERAVVRRTILAESAEHDRAKNALYLREIGILEEP